MSWLVDPFADFIFMQRALLGCLAISLGATPVGVFSAPAPDEPDR